MNQWRACKIGKDKLKVSHLFFADDLLLFTEASSRQAKVTKEILQIFFGESGQKVNATKSKAWYSPNTPLSLIRTVTGNFGIPSTTDLGKYLGVPFVHGRLRSQPFGYLLDRIHGRLSGWKSKLLSQASRLLLIHSVYRRGV